MAGWEAAKVAQVQQVVVRTASHDAEKEKA